MRKINHLIKQKKRSMVLLLPAKVQQAILDFFQCWWGFLMFLPYQYQCGDHHDPLLLHMGTLLSGTTHCTHVLLGAMCPFPHWVRYFPRSMVFCHLTSLCLHLHLHLILFTKLIPLVILVGIAILTHQVALTHIIPLHLAPLLISPTVVVFVLIV